MREKLFSNVITFIQIKDKIGEYLLWRHSILERLMKLINKDAFSLEQVERIEHFVDDITLKNIEAFLNTNL